MDHDYANIPQHAPLSDEDEDERNKSRSAGTSCGTISDSHTFNQPTKSCCSGNSRCDKISGNVTIPKSNVNQSGCCEDLSLYLESDQDDTPKALLGSSIGSDCCEGYCAGKPSSTTACASSSSCVMAKGCCKTTTIGCSSMKSCGSATSPSTRMLPISASHPRAKVSTANLTGNSTERTITDSNELMAVAIRTNSVQVCSECDPTNADALPHAYVVTRLRIANLCCAMEESLVHRILDNQKVVWQILPIQRVISSCYLVHIPY